MSATPTPSPACPSPAPAPGAVPAAGAGAAPVAGCEAVARAPGKLFVAGEYAVVEPGRQALLVAVDRYVTVRVRAGREPGVVVRTDLRPGAVRHRWHGQRLQGAGGRMPHVPAAVETVAALLREHGLPVPALSVSVTSTLHEGGRKIGLGSSGAVTVAVVEAVAAHCGLALDRAQRLRLALVAAARIDPAGSGGDLAAAAWGGWLAYRAPDRRHVRALVRRHGVGGALAAPWPGFSVRAVPAPAGLSLQVGWTGSPASTASLVAGLHASGWRGGAAHARFLRASDAFVGGAVTALNEGDAPGLLHQVRTARSELARLDEAVGLGLRTPALDALCEAAEAAGGAAKPSGAGGGDCGIALLASENPHDIASVHRRWTAAGVLPLALAPAPATGRTEQ
ncbi:phosphomevalonate kinase [Streptomyces sp. NPDC003717]|uniref:phosphomevalonate kinase n=1 Tax=Streptomyces sp. NPDC003717 TaxID=3154276 RepID=UPI0033B7E9EA